MRKQLLALLSVLGLVGSSTPASGQVVKGSQPANTKSESPIKGEKAAQQVQQPGAGQNATQDVVISTKPNQASEPNAVKKDSSKKVLIGLSQPSKSGDGQANAGKKDSSKKVLIGLSQPSKTGDNQANSAKKDSSKKVLIGLSQPSQAGDSDAKKKLHKTSAESSAGLSAAADKHRKSNAAMGDGSVRNAAGPGGGAGKASNQDFVIKGNKNAAENNAASSTHIKKLNNSAAEAAAAAQDANKKAVKTDQPKP